MSRPDVSDAVADTSRARALRGIAPLWVALGLLLVPIAIAYRDTWMSLVHTWRVDTSFSHGFLIVPMSLYLMWDKRQALAGAPVGPSWIGVALLVVAVLLWTIGTLVQVRVIEQIGFVGVLQSLVPLVFGLRVTHLLLFPLAFLLFAVPMGKGLVPPLMEITADLSVFFLRLTGVPVFRDGMLLHIPAGTYEVARACSGIKFLTAAVAIGVFYAYLTYSGLRKRITFVLVAVAVAILSNGVRAYLLVLIGHLTDMRFEHDRWHIVLGYVIFAAVLLLLLQIGARYRDLPAATRIRTGAGVSYPPAGAFGSAAAAPLLAGCGLIALAPLYAMRVVETGSSAEMIRAMSTPVTAADGWVMQDVQPAWQPSVSGGSVSSSVTYASDSGSVDVFMEVFPLPGAVGGEMISYRNSIQADSNERLYQDRARAVELGPGRGSVTVRETIVPGLRPRLVWYWFDVAGHPAVGEARAKLLEAAVLLRHGRGTQRLVVVSTEMPSQEAARGCLSRFIAAHLEQLGVRGTDH
jgi:exosortase A